VYLAFDVRERAVILREYHSVFSEWERLDYEVTVGRADTTAVAEYYRLSRKLLDCTDRYREGVPLVPVSRCPFTGEVVYHSLDPFGIDGLWWRYRAPIRPLERLPRTFAGLSGAMRIAEPLERNPFEVRPGPTAPFLIPRIMQDPEVTAVVSSVRIGRHDGYPVCYFASSRGQVFPRCNTWGSDRWVLLDHDGVLQWDEVDDNESLFSYDLESWIREGRLLWISEADPTVSLRRGLEGCPYLGLTVRQDPGRIVGDEFADQGGKA